MPPKRPRKRNQELAIGNREAYFRSTKAPGPIQGLNPGETVTYTRYFLMQIGVSPTDDMWRRHGEFLGLHSNGRWAKIQWKGEAEPSYVALQHLSRPGPNTRHCD